MRTLRARSFAARQFRPRTLHGPPDASDTASDEAKATLHDKRRRRPPDDFLPQPQYDWLIPVMLAALLEADDPY